MGMIEKTLRLSRRGKESEREVAGMTSLARSSVVKWLRAELDGAPKYRRGVQPSKRPSFRETLAQALNADAHRPGSLKPTHEKKQEPSIRLNHKSQDVVACTRLVRRCHPARRYRRNGIRRSIVRTCSPLPRNIVQR